MCTLFNILEYDILRQKDSCLKESMFVRNVVCKMKHEMTKMSRYRSSMSIVTF